MILGMSKPEGIYLSVDYRVTDARTQALVDDASVKSLTVHYPPLDNGGPKVLMGFTGVAILPDGTPTMTWVRETLRGETEVIDQSMAHLRARLNRDMARLRAPLIINVLVLEKDRRLFGGLSNISRSPVGQVSVAREFGYVMRELDDWSMFANGSGAEVALTGGHLARLQPHLGVVPREPVNHMKLLATINRRIATNDRRVSPFCHVSFINADDRFGPTSRAFVENGESAPFNMSMLLGGIDLTEMMSDFMNHSQAFFNGEISELPEPDPAEMNERLKRRP